MCVYTIVMSRSRMKVRMSGDKGSMILNTNTCTYTCTFRAHIPLSLCPLPFPPHSSPSPYISSPPTPLPLPTSPPLPLLHLSLHPLQSPPIPLPPPSLLTLHWRALLPVKAPAIHPPFQSGQERLPLSLNVLLEHFHIQLIQLLCNGLQEGRPTHLSTSTFM